MNAKYDMNARAFEAEMLCERLRAENEQYARDVQRLLETIKFVTGIAKVGLGREIGENETVEAFVLGYVKQLEVKEFRLGAALARIAKYPTRRREKLSADGLREIARGALAEIARGALAEIESIDRKADHTKQEEVIRWRRTAEELPDSDETVLMIHVGGAVDTAYRPVAESSVSGMGYLDGDKWRAMEGDTIHAPTFWAPMFEGPGARP